MTVEYKFVELSTVTEDTLERTVNEWVGRGWQLDGIRFVTTDASRRPSMAFVSFVRPAAADARAAGDGRGRGERRPTLRSLAELSGDGAADDPDDPFVELDLEAMERDSAAPPRERGRPTPPPRSRGQRRKKRS